MGAARPLWRRLLSRNSELLTLLLILLVAGGAWVFIELADEVVEGETQAIDQIILLSLRNPDDPAQPLGPLWVQELFRDLSALGGFGIITLITAAVCGFLMLQGKYRTLRLLVIAVISGVLVSATLKFGFSRPRPDLVPHGSYTYTSSFPSGHAMLAAVTYLTLATLLAGVQAATRLKIFIFGVAMVFTMLAGISRVYLGVHWPSDVLAGWTLGTVWALLWWLVAHWIQQYGDA